MKIKNVLIWLLIIAPLHLQASFLEPFWKNLSTISKFYTQLIHPKTNSTNCVHTQNTNAHSSLDELINQKIHTYIEQEKFLPKHISSSDKAFYSYKQQKINEIFVNKLIADSIELQNKPVFKNANNTTICEIATQAAKKAHYNAHQELEGIWLFIKRVHAHEPINSKLNSTERLFTQMQTSNKATMREKFIEAHQKLTKEQQAKKLVTYTKSLLGQNDTHASFKVGYSNDNTIYTITTHKSLINPELLTKPGKSTGITYYPNQAAKDKQKINFDQSNPRHAYTEDAPPTLSQNPSLPLHLINKNKTVSKIFDFSPQKESAFDKRYKVTSHQAARDKNINPALFAGQAQSVGSTQNNIHEDIRYNRIIKFQQIPKEYRHDEYGNPCENGYRDKYGNIPEID